MRQRIEVTGDGIIVTSVTEPLISVFGQVVRPGATDVVELPWVEISQISVSAIELPPDGLRWVSLTVDTTWGEYFELAEDAVGYAATVSELCRRSGLRLPDSSASTPAHQVIWTPDRSQLLGLSEDGRVQQ
ncbi:hypothetical protein KOI35_14690 [Actinoplanes bogorensis]|uniref:Uncharacterized protein n=1 Tax=Paractinoplanes bogorensis TaxID=1610840 RepID=A0ABS5YMZ6_9ACTN|nr:hypothetical protein [Actinoplanes bogorensis]MBU2664748.1 hypothetical protein [Actinoplanes bogorensis]